MSSLSMARLTGVPRVLPSKTPLRMRTVSDSLRWVTRALWPGARRSRSGWISASDRGRSGGQPSITAPMAGPWDSPQVVTRNRWPNVLPMAPASVCRDQRRQDLADAAVQHDIRQVVHRRGVAIDDDDARARRFRRRHHARDGIDAERRAHGEEQIGDLGGGLRALEIFADEALAEGDRGGLQDAATAPARGIGLARAHPREGALHGRPLPAREARHLAHGAVDLDDAARVGARLLVEAVHVLRDEGV